MLLCEEFINQLDGKTLKRIYSDSNFYIKEIRTNIEYTEAVIPYSRDIEEFVETTKKTEEDINLD